MLTMGAEKGRYQRIKRKVPKGQKEGKGNHSG
jgi:hypothetical protein